MTSPPSLLCSSIVAVITGVFFGCTPKECDTSTDCDAGQICQSDRCVTPLPAGAPRSTLSPSAGAGVGENTALQQVRTSLPVAWMQRDPGDPSRIWFAQQQSLDSGFTQDDVLAFHPGTGEVDPTPILELLGMASGPCGLDVVHRTFRAGETWLSCAVAPTLRVIYDEAFLGPTTDIEAGAALLHFVPSASTSDFGRVLIAGRGGDLRALQLRSTDAFGQTRNFDVIEPTLSGVVALFDVEDAGIPGDHVLVHDRNRSQLVPLTRSPLTEQWSESSALPPRTLPLDTHVVWVFGQIQATGFSTTSTTPNYLTIEPNTGLVRYFNYEVGQEILPSTRFERDTSFQSELPDADARLLIDLSPSGEFLFYAREDGRRVYRIPLVPGGDALVRIARIEESGRAISSLIALDEESVWVSDSLQPLLQKVSVTETP